MSDTAGAPPHALNVVARVKNSLKSTEQQEQELAEARKKAYDKIKDTSNKYQSITNALQGEIETMKRACLAARTNRDLLPMAKRTLQRIMYRRKRVQMLNNAISMCDKLEHMMDVTFDMIPLKNTISNVQTVLDSVAASTVMKELEKIVASLDDTIAKVDKAVDTTDDIQKSFDSMNVVFNDTGEFDNESLMKELDTLMEEQQQQQQQQQQKPAQSAPDPSANLLDKV